MPKIKFTFAIECTNAAFVLDASEPNIETSRKEVARLLRQSADMVEAGETVSPLYDFNRCKVGGFSFSF